MADSGGVLGGPLWSPMERAGPGGGGGGGGGGEERTEQRASEQTAGSQSSQRSLLSPLGLRAGFSRERACECVCVCAR